MARLSAAPALNRKNLLVSASSIESFRDSFSGRLTPSITEEGARIGFSFIDSFSYHQRVDDSFGAFA